MLLTCHAIFLGAPPEVAFFKPLSGCSFVFAGEVLKKTEFPEAPLRWIFGAITKENGRFLPMQN